MIQRNKYEMGESSASPDCYYYEYELTCDLCGRSFGVYNSFQEAVDAKKRNHIRSVKNDDDTWTELCPSCNRGGLTHEG